MRAGRPPSQSGDVEPAVGSPSLEAFAIASIDDPGEPDDAAVVRAVLDGDREAFRVLVDREAASVLRACRRVLGDAHDAEDAAQEAFVTAYRSLSTWRADGPFGAWLTRIAIRIAIRQVGRRRTVTWRDPAPAHLADGAVDPVTAAVDRASLAASPTTDPSALALRGERAADVRTAVAALTDPYREVVSLRFFGELSLDEIAHETGRPLGTIKTQLHRGLARLRAELIEVAR